MKSKLFCKYFIIALCGTYLLAPPPAKAENADMPAICISEVNWAGSSLSTSDEWIELVNVTTQDISLSRWSLVGAGSSGKILFLPDDAVISAHSTYLISNFDWSDERSALLVEPNTVTSTLSLSNSALAIELFDNQGNAIDIAGDAQTPLAGNSGDIKISMQRLDCALPGYLADAWIDATIGDGLSTDDMGTPGYAEIYVLLDSETTPTDFQIIEEQTATSTITDFDTNTETSATGTVTTINNNVNVDPASQNQASSTEVLLENTNTTTTTNIIEEINNNPTITSADNTTIYTQNNLNNQALVRLSEVMVDPQEGSEWIEITSTMPDRTIDLEGLYIFDAVSKILSLSGTLSADQPYLVFNLNSSKLNNGGDSVNIKTGDGLLIDTFNYSDSDKGVSWATDSLGSWRLCTEPTPGMANIITISKTETIAEQKTEETKPETKQTVSPQVSSPPSATSPTKSTPIKPVIITTKKTEVQTKNNTPIQKIASPTAKTSITKAQPENLTDSQASAKSNKNLQEIDFDMLNNETYGGVRVMLRGIVGTPAQLLTSRAFILLNQDGKGLLVKVPTDRKMPNYGLFLEVTGTLKFDSHDLPYLSLSSKDEWRIIDDDLTQPKYHEAALYAPSVEDAWSLVNVTGTVLEVKTSIFNLLVDDMEIQVKIRPGVGYRAKRLITGDLVNITGLLDTTGELVIILPRSVDDIQLISHPIKEEMQNQTKTTSGVPGWTPFGAAIGAIGTIEGFKKVRTKLKKSVKSEIKKSACSSG